MFLAVFVIARLTKLGDTELYLNSSIPFSLKGLFISTDLIIYLVRIIKLVFRLDIIVHFFFCITSIVGIIYPLKKLSLSKRNYRLLFFLLMLPSFGIWTSIVGKDALGAYAIGIIIGKLIDYSNKGKIKYDFLLCSALYLLAVLKPQYFIALVNIFFLIFLNKKVKDKLVWGIIVISQIVFCVAVLLYFSDTIDQLARMMEQHFSLSSNTTRQNQFWLEKNDFFKKIPIGFYLSFVGPSLSEVNNLLTLSAFIESWIIIIVMTFIVSEKLIIRISLGKLHVRNIYMYFSTVFWIMLVHYPFGLLNPGSANRYRSNFIHFIIIMGFVIFNQLYYEGRDLKRIYGK
ncbi:hypothetical protein [Ancylomarina longa]|nr:hypothetical protein [Ancylomarina longa]